jgi:hypothetical protein
MAPNIDVGIIAIRPQSEQQVVREFRPGKVIRGGRRPAHELGPRAARVGRIYGHQVDGLAVEPRGRLPRQGQGDERRIGQLAPVPDPFPGLAQLLGSQREAGDLVLGREGVPGHQDGALWLLRRPVDDDRLLVGLDREPLQHRFVGEQDGGVIVPR